MNPSRVLWSDAGNSIALTMQGHEPCLVFGSSTGEMAVYRISDAQPAGVLSSETVRSVMLAALGQKTQQD